MSKNKKKRKGYPFRNKSNIKFKDKDEEIEPLKPKSPPRYGVYKKR